MSQSLDNIRVLVTRPQQQSEDLCALIEAAGAVAVNFPLLEIEPNSDAESTQRCQFVSGYDWVIFISQNAVRYALSLLPKNNWTDNTAIAAIGNGTTNALQQAGLPVDVQPNEIMNSEALLKVLAEKSLVDKKILIIRGKGGREALADGLKEKKARVDYAEVYRRVCPIIEQAKLSTLVDEGIDVISIASGETLHNLVSTMKSANLSDAQVQQLKSCTLIVVSERIKQIAIELGFTGTLVVASKPDNAGTVKAIVQWRSGENA